MRVAARSRTSLTAASSHSRQSSGWPFYSIPLAGRSRLPPPLAGESPRLVAARSQGLRIDAPAVTGRGSFFQFHH